MAVGEETVKLLSCEGEVFEVSKDVARVSRTLATMFAELGHQPNDLIPLPNVSTKILKKVLAWAEHYVEEQKASSPLPATPPQVPHPPSSPTNLTTRQNAPFQPRPHPHVPQRPSHQVQPPPSHTLTQWEKEFISKNKDDIYDLLLAANYLDIKGLLDILCRAIAEMIKGKDPEDIRRAFHASNPSHLQTDTPPSSPVQQPHSTSSPTSSSGEQTNRSRGHKETSI